MTTPISSADPHKTLTAPSIIMLSTGTMWVDGGLVFGNTPKITWNEYVHGNRRNEVPLPSNAILVQTLSAIILINPGLGKILANKDHSSYETHGSAKSMLAIQLKKMGLRQKMITHIVLHDLLMHHAGGAIKRGYFEELTATFPNAKVIVQKDAITEATNSPETPTSWYDQGVTKAIQDLLNLSLINGDQEVTPGVRVQLTGGPSLGHQIAIITIGSERLIAPGGIIPTRHHLQSPPNPMLNRDSKTTQEARTAIMKLAAEKGYILCLENEPLESCRVQLTQRNHGDVLVRTMAG